MSSNLVFKHESTCKVIYSIDIWAYPIMAYLILDLSLKNLPPWSCISFVWIMGIISTILWAIILFLKLWNGLHWDQTPQDREMALWIVEYVMIQPLFFLALANCSQKWNWFIIFGLYRAWTVRRMLMFLQEVREKMFILSISDKGSK